MGFSINGGVMAAPQETGMAVAPRLGSKDYDTIRYDRTRKKHSREQATTEISDLKLSLAVAFSCT